MRREQTLRKEKADADEATRKHEQLYMEHELKRQKVMVEANTTLQQERVKAGVYREVAHMEANFASSRRGNVSKPGTPNLNCVSWQLKNLKKEYSLTES